MSEPDGRATHPGIRDVNPGLLLVETAWTGWLGHAHAVFTGVEGGPAMLAAAGLGLAGGLASVIAGGTPLRPWRGATGLTAFAILAGFVTPALTPVYSWSTVGWLTLVAGITGLLLRRPGSSLHRGTVRDCLAEASRWVLLLTAGTLLMLPFYTHRPIGSGDAHWYTLMLSDFVLQVRAGVFPVWAGQTEYAFNGAVNPLRLAPWFQHAGALLDLLTIRSLGLIPLKNALLAVNFIVLAATAYAGLCRLLPGWRNAAAALALLLLASPAMLAPLYTGDQYMTILALPFACLAVFGMAGVLEDNRWPRHVPLCVGLAGLWLTHTPIALWLSVLLACAYLVRLGFARPPGWSRRLALSLVAFTVLGSYPVISVLHLENTATLSAEATGGAAAEQVARLFPGSLLPLSKTLTEPTDYQPGYALVAIVMLACLSMCRRRTSITTVGFAVSIGLVLLLLLPVPAWADLVWRHLPLWVMKINGNWPHQRLVPIAAILAVGLGALTLRGLSPPGSRAIRAGMAVLALGALGWSGWQAAGFVRSGWRHTGRGPNPTLGFQTNNLSLTRYAFSSFAATPGYFTHGYINPRLEHRLLRADGSVLVANGIAAARDPIGTLVTAGIFTAVNDNRSAHYNLEPRIWLPGRQQLLLKLMPLEPVEHGWLQIVGQDLFREYILPDSGTGTVRSEPRAFGTLPGLSPYVPLQTWRRHGEVPRLTVILPGIGIREPFPFARFELWQFDPARLPVAVRSWAPYRLHVSASEPALLETPRAWLPGYYARLNGQHLPALRSADGLAAFAVPAGEYDMTVHYAPPPIVSVAYWLTVVGWLLVALAILRQYWTAGTPQRDAAG